MSELENYYIRVWMKMSISLGKIRRNVFLRLDRYYNTFGFLRFLVLLIVQLVKIGEIVKLNLN